MTRITMILILMAGLSGCGASAKFGMQLHNDYLEICLPCVNYSYVDVRESSGKEKSIGVSFILLANPDYAKRKHGMCIGKYPQVCIGLFWDNWGDN